MDDIDMGLRELEAHFQLVAVLLMNSNRSPPFLAPLLQLALEPQRVAEAFLPTMPSDDLYELRQIITTRDPGDHLRVTSRMTFYTCANGHPFSVGSCGSPQVVSKCQCGAIIGMGVSNQTRMGEYGIQKLF